MRRGLLVSILLFAGTVQGQHPLHKHKQEGTPHPGEPRLVPNTHERAGFPQSLGHHLEPSKTSGGIGYYVGGGVPLWGHPHPRSEQDGTWGWDDTGWHAFRRRSFLGWSHGQKYQGGAGAYRVDGHHVPDPVFGLTNKILDHHRADPAE